MSETTETTFAVMQGGKHTLLNIDASKALVLNVASAIGLDLATAETVQLRHCVGLALAIANKDVTNAIEALGLGTVSRNSAESKAQAYLLNNATATADEYERFLDELLDGNNSKDRIAKQLSYLFEFVARIRVQAVQAEAVQDE